MYDDISTFKKKANLANFNFRSIAYNNDAPNPDGDPMVPANPPQIQTGDERPETPRHRPAEAFSPQRPDAGGSGTAQARREEPASPLENRASYASAHDITAGVRAAMDIPAGEDAAYQSDNGSVISNEIPLFSLFKSISSKV